MKPLRTVALLARQPGLNVLTDALLDHPLLDLAAVYTHARLPKAEGGGTRPEASRFAEICRKAGVPLEFLDFPAARDLDRHLPPGTLDLMVVTSWRFLIPAAALDRLRLGGLNLHRGALPEYAGAEPVRRAIEAGESRVAITAHRLTPEIDGGPAVSVVWLDLGARAPSSDAAAFAEDIKRRLEPLYAPLARTAIAAMLA